MGFNDYHLSHLLFYEKLRKPMVDPPGPPTKQCGFAIAYMIINYNINVHCIAHCVINCNTLYNLLC